MRSPISPLKSARTFVHPHFKRTTDDAALCIGGREGKIKIEKKGGFLEGIMCFRLVLQ